MCSSFSPILVNTLLTCVLAQRAHLVVCLRRMIFQKKITLELFSSHFSTAHFVFTVSEVPGGLLSRGCPVTA